MQRKTPRNKKSAYATDGEPNSSIVAGVDQLNEVELDELLNEMMEAYETQQSQVCNPTLVTPPNEGHTTQPEAS